LPAHAGFAYAIQIRKKVLNDSILLAYHAEKISRRLVAGLIGGPPDVSTNFYLDPPLISFDPDRTDGFVLTLTGSGRLGVAFDVFSAESREVQFQMVALVKPRFAVGAGELSFSPTTEDLTLLSWTFSLIDSWPFSTNANAYLTSAVFRERLEANLALALASGLLEIPPIKIGALGSSFDISNTTSVSRVLDESILVGLNLEVGALHVVGEIQELTSFAGSHDIALILNPDVLPVVFADALAQVTSAVADADATLDAFTITAGTSKIAIAGSAHNEFGSVDFSLDAVAALFAARPGKYFQYLDRHVQVNTRIWPAINFRVENVHVSVHPATWVRVVQVVGALLTGAVVPLFIQDLIRGVTQQVTFGTRNASPGPSVPRVQHLEPTRAGDPRVKLRINDFSIRPDAIFAGLGVTPEFRSAVLMGLTSIPANYLSRPIRYRIIPPIGVFDDEPYLRIRWQVQDLNSGQLVVDEDDVAAGRLERDLRVADFGGDDVALGISCELYRKVGSEITPLFSDGIRLAISAPLLPGVLTRWRYVVKNPQVTYSEKDEEWKYLGDSLVRRWSAVHRLDKPCRMATKQSKYVDTTVMLDDFPYPLTEVANRRQGLCAYCFFGGPGEKRPFL
jgi:hypothetical protein